uniref:THO complex subunit 2 n=1 Tax=Megaselia scalaris TaxID=36166 RepID=T1GUM3_MEGSC
YKQRRFNLFREESEGYSKLISELNQEFDENRSAASVMDIIKSLIGCFNLDPNRVLDVILESFETRLSKYRLFIQLLRSYMPNSTIISEVLGYKFRHFAENNEVTPFSLYQITALLLKYGVINLTDIYVWLSPLDSTITENWHKSIAEANEFVRKMNVILTNKDSDPVEPEQYNPEEGYMSNQKFGLCEALLKVGDWENSLTIINQLPEQCVLVHELIAKALADIVHVSIDRLYSTKCFNSKQKKSRLYDDKKLLKEIQANSYNDLLKHAFPMTKTLGPSLRFDTILINKLLRIMKKILTEMNVDNLNLPASGSDDEILYNEIINVLDSALMKRVSKDNVKPIGRLIGKLSHCASGILFDYILLQIQIYDNLIGPVVDSFKYLTNLSFDMLGYCIVESLTKGDRDRFRDDGTSLSMWLQSLASFCGSIYKKYNIELSGLLQYVANQLKSQKSLDLLILKEVVQKMAGVESAEEFTNEQLNAMSGGELLRGEAGYFSQVRNTKKSSQRLKDALASNDLAVALCLLMAQQKHCVIYRETAQNHLKLVGKLYDQCQDTLVQFGTFLGSSYSQKYDQLRKSDPNSKKLTSSQKLQKYLEATQAIINPIVESVRPLYSLKIWEDISPQFLVTFWSLSMYDLQVPVDTYKKEIDKLSLLSSSKDVPNS